MSKQYKGKDVTVVRPWRQGDAGYNATDKKVLIRHADGKEELVFETQVTGNA